MIQNPVSPSRELLEQLLHDYWGYSAFHPLQEAIIRSVMAGQDTLALMPTGGGKSLCYQVPAMAGQGLCLVISPLIALMKDQVGNLRKKGITAFAIYAGMRRKEVVNTLETAAESNCKLLYVSPERLETNLFKEYLPGLNIHLIAVDEAHCISQWGYDFRPPYLRIAALREELPGIPVLALTASATPEVQHDICEKLAFKHPAVFRQSFERPNLSYSVFDTDSKINKLVSVLQHVGGSSIVYCKSRRSTRQVAEQLQSYQISADFYHAGLTAAERHQKQEDWMCNTTRVIVCTNAFGMGIDKPDVRTVVHMDIPVCLENYYQEAGRAGRDKKRSYAVLLYRPEDLEELKAQAAIRYPGMAAIRRVYGAVAAYLQLPEGSGEGLFYDFDLADFTRKFNLDTNEVIYALKALEQEGWMSFNEQVFLPAKLQFTCNKETLYRFEQDYPEKEALVKLLLRSYEGIFDMPVAVHEKQLAAWLSTTAEAVQQMLGMLQAHHIIRYEPRKDSPQLWICRPRIKTADLHIQQAAYRKRRRQFEQRVQYLLDYAAQQHHCRSVMIGNYFGDNSIQRCGICDNCLRQKASPLTETAFLQISREIGQALMDGPLTTEELLAKMKHVAREKTWQVLEFLVAEKRIVLNKDGRVEALPG